MTRRRWARVGLYTAPIVTVFNMKLGLAVWSASAVMLWLFRYEP